jgi:hypothetical protein
MAMIPPVLTGMFLSSPQPTEGATERRSNRVGACLPHACRNKGLLMHILQAGPAKSEAEWATSETRRWGVLDAP